MVQKDREFLSIVIAMQCWELRNFFRLYSKAWVHIAPYFLAKSLIIFFKRLLLDNKRFELVSKGG